MSHFLDGENIFAKNNPRGLSAAEVAHDVHLEPEYNAPAAVDTSCGGIGYNVLTVMLRPPSYGSNLPPSR